MKNETTPKRSPSKLLGGLVKANERGEDVNINTAASFIEEPKKEKEPIIKTSLDLKVSMEENIQKLIYWGRIGTRKEVIEIALTDLFVKHADLLKPLPPKINGN
jgi:hypothetical protein